MGVGASYCIANEAIAIEAVCFRKEAPMSRNFFDGTDAELYTGSQHFRELSDVQPLI